MLEPLGLTHTQFLVLASVNLLGADDQIVTQADVSRFAAMDENMTSQVLRTLEHNLLIERLPHPNDARARSLGLTKKGEETVEAARKVLKVEKERMFECLGNRVDELASLLGEVARANQETD